MDGDVPHSPSYGVYIWYLICFMKVRFKLNLIQ